MPGTHKALGVGSTQLVKLRFWKLPLLAQGSRAGKGDWAPAPFHASLIPGKRLWMESPSHLTHSMALTFGCHPGTRSLSGVTCGLTPVLAPVIFQEAWHKACCLADTYFDSYPAIGPNTWTNVHRS